LTRSPDGRSTFDGASTTHRTPAAVNALASPNPVGPASYATATGPGNDATQDTTAFTSGASRSDRISPETPSIAVPTTERA
jgi:hypothetical protein